MSVAPPSPLDTVRALLGALGRKDFDTALALVSDDCEYTNVPLGTVQGRAGVRAVLEPFLGPTSENELIERRAATDGEMVFIERLDRHHIATGWVELPVTGVWEVRDGLVTVWRDYFDLATIAKSWPTPLA